MLLGIRNGLLAVVAEVVCGRRVCGRRVCDAVIAIKAQGWRIEAGNISFSSIYCVTRIEQRDYNFAHKASCTSSPRHVIH
jgi:hypothetical protein